MTIGAIHQPVLSYQFRVRFDFIDYPHDHFSCNVNNVNVDLLNKKMTISMRQTTSPEQTGEVMNFAKMLLRSKPDAVVDFLKNSTDEKHYEMVFTDITVCKYDIPLDYSSSNMLNHDVVLQFKDFMIRFEKPEAKGA